MSSPVVLFCSLHWLSLFPKKGDLGLAKNYRGTTLTSIAAKIYNALQRNCIEPKIEKSIHDITNFDNLSNSRSCICKKTLRQQYYSSTSPRPLTRRKDGENTYFSLDVMKENRFKLAKERSRRYPAQTITDVDYADDIALLANTPARAETLLHSLEWAAVGIGLNINVEKTDYMCFNQRGDISTLNGGPLKLVNKFTYLGNSESSLQCDMQKHGQLLIGYRSYASHTWPIK